MGKDERRPAGSSDGQTGSETLRLIESSELFGGAQEIGILHAGDIYRLRITRFGKLILNK